MVQDKVNMNVAFAYARKSSEQEDRQIPSIADQLTGIDELQKKHGIPIKEDGIFQDSMTAKIAGVRVNFNEMIRRIKRGEADTLYVDVINRIARNAKEAGEIIDLLDTGKLKQIIAPYAVYNKDTNSEMLWIEFMSSTKFSKDLSKVVTERLHRKAERGDYPSGAPIGYKNTPTRLKGTRIVLVDKQRWGLCRKWWEYMLTGIYTVEQTLDLVTADGLRTKKGKIISRTKAYAFFRDIFYTGNFKYKGVVYPGNHKAIVSMAEWVKVQQLLDKKGKKGAGTLETPEEKTFQGMLKCGECGATISMERHIRHYKNGNSQVFWYYRCTKKLGPCSQPTLNATFFKPQIESYISQLELNPKYAELIKKVLKRRNAQEFGLEKKSQELRTKRLAIITDEKKKLYDMKIDELFSEEEYQEQKKKLLIEEKLLRESYQKPVTAYWESVIDNTVNFATSVSQLFQYGDIFTRQMVLRILGSNLILKDKIVKIEAKNAFVFLRDVQNETFQENLWLEPKNVPTLPAKQTSFVKESSTVRTRGLEPPFLV